MSIKSKLLTAVTTAGLLASLFGTALLPVARAAVQDGSVDVLDVTSSDGDIKGGVEPTFYVAAGKTITVNINLTPGGVDGGGDDRIDDTVTVTVAGSTFSAWTPQAVSTLGLGISANFRVATAVMENHLETNDLVISVAGIAAGVTATVTATDSAGDDTDTIYLIGVGAGSYGVPAASTSTFDKQCDPSDSDGAAAGGAGCWVTKVDYIEPFGVIGYELDILDALDETVTTYPVTATITGGVAGVAIEAAQDGACDISDDESSSDVDLGDATVMVCVLSDGTEALPFTLTVTVGSLSYTRKIGVAGEIKTLALTGPAAVATIGHENMVDAEQWAEEYADQYVVVAKDAAGNILGNGGGDPMALKSNGIDATNSGNGIGNTALDGEYGTALPGTDFDFSVTDGDGISLSFDTNYGYWYMKSNMTGQSHDTDDWKDGFLDVKVLAGTRFGPDALGADNYVVAQPGDLAFNVPSDLCDEGDEGETRKIKVVDDTGTISSNVVTTTCVNDAVKLSGATASAASVAKNGSVTFTFSATDGEGRPVGIGASAGITVTPSWEAASSATLHFYGSTATLKYTMDSPSGSQYLILGRTDNDPIASGNQSWAEKYTVSVTNAADAFTAPSFYKSTVVKARAVAIFPAAAGKTITFTVENGRTGVVRTYYRKADASGKAWYTIAAPGTYYVTALYNGESTDTLRLVK